MNKVSEETENSQDSNPPDNENNNHVGRIANKRRRTEEEIESYSTISETVQTSKSDKRKSKAAGKAREIEIDDSKQHRSRSRSQTRDDEIYKRKNAKAQNNNE